MLLKYVIILVKFRIKVMCYMLKKLCLLLLITGAIFGVVISASAEILYSGSCGENVTYTVDDKYNLVISGEGAMDDFAGALDKNIPWYDYHSQINKVYVEEGITSIGKAAFSRCHSLESVALPETLVSISNRAFLLCSSLKEVFVPNKVETIQVYSFSDCTSLSCVRLSNSVAEVQSQAFDNCDSLQTVYFYGTEEEWNAININPEGNETLLNADIVYISEVQPVSISIDTKSEYVIGFDERLDITVNLNYNDGTQTTLSPEEYTIDTNFDVTAQGTYTVKATYGDFTTETTVNVVPVRIKSIAVTTPPNTTEFIEGTDINLEGMVVTAIYNNETTEEITDYEITHYDNTKIGSQIVYVKYGGRTARINITVVKKSIIGIKIVSLPNKISYCDDDDVFRKEGLKVDILYNNNTTENCDNYGILGFEPRKDGTQTIRILYGGFEDTFDIYVRYYEYKIASNISKQYDFDTKTLTVGTSITSRTESGAAKVIVCVYNADGALIKTAIKNVFFDTNEVKDLSIDVPDVSYPFDKVKVFAWDYDIAKMYPMAVGV